MGLMMFGRLKYKQLIISKWV